MTRAELGTDLVFVVRVVLSVSEANRYRRYEDTDGSVYESTDESIVADALDYFRGWHNDADIETFDGEPLQWCVSHNSIRPRDGRGACWARYDTPCRFESQIRIKAPEGGT